MEPTRKGHFVNINPKRKSWCFERYLFTVDDKCISREDENQAKIKYRFDYQNNMCKKLETNQCTFNGNVFNTIEECLVDCLPSRFECSNCELSKFNKLKAQKCKAIAENSIQCSIKYKTFNMAPLIVEVEKIRNGSGHLKVYSTNLVTLILIAIFKSYFLNLIAY